MSIEEARSLSSLWWYEPAERIAVAAESAGIRLSTPIVGEPVDYRGIAATAWWRTAMAGKEEMP